MFERCTDDYDDYTDARVPMLPVVAGTRVTRNQILAYSLILAPAAVLPAFTQIGGPVYFFVALALNARLLQGAVAIWRRDDAAAAADKFRVEKRFFGFSIAYLFLHFVLLLVEASIRGLGLGVDAWPVLL